MEGLGFQTATAPVPSDPARADIACFVGLVAARDSGATLRARLERALGELGWTGPALPGGDRVLPETTLPPGPTPSAFAAWLRGRGWQSTPGATADADLFRRAAGRVLTDAVANWWADNAWLSSLSGRSAADLLEINDVPVPIDTWDAFDTLFSWERRPLVEGRTADTMLGAAVRRFFVQGGRKCYVIRVGDPWPAFTSLETRTSRLPRILDPIAGPSPVDRLSWRGVGHLFGLVDVSFLCLPDLPDFFAADPPPAVPEPPPMGEERFIECGTRIGPPPSTSLRSFAAPRCNETGFADWAAFVRRIGALVQRHSREVQFVASVPLPEQTPGGAMSGAIGRDAQWDAVSTIQTAFVQLAYPWLRTRDARRLPGSVEAPDGMLVGVLASNALTAGTWRSAARQPLFGVTGLEPLLAATQLETPLPYRDAVGLRRVSRTLRERISVFAPTPTGVNLLSDVTTDDDEAYRPANVTRLVAALVRAARLSGESAVFMNNGEMLWRRLRFALEGVLLRLWGDGALFGSSSSEAFEVRCDRSTMTQADLDAGRVIARVQFTAASPIEQITVVLAMDEGGQVSLMPVAPRETSGTPA